MLEFSIRIQNNKGMHARASAKFVETVESFNANCEIQKDGMKVSGDSIMGILMLAASKGSVIKVTAWGDDSQLLVKALKLLINNKFDEES